MTIWREVKRFESSRSIKIDSEGPLNSAITSGFEYWDATGRRLASSGIECAAGEAARRADTHAHRMHGHDVSR